MNVYYQVVDVAEQESYNVAGTYSTYEAAEQHCKDGVPPDYMGTVTWEIRKVWTNSKIRAED